MIEDKQAFLDAAAIAFAAAQFVRTGDFEPDDAYDDAAALWSERERRREHGDA